MGCGFSFIHCADLHLGSRFWGLTNKDPELGRKLYQATFSSFSRIVDIGIAEADFMVVSGDIYDELVETPRTRAFFASEMKRFGKPCFIVTGNHDHVHGWSESIPYPENVIQFGTEPSKARLRIRETQIEIAGVSFNGSHTEENLVSKIRGTPGMFTIGVVHCSVGSIGDSHPYAPCTMEDFMGKDIQYWALGHIHKRMVLRDSEPMVVYPGNIQGRDINESGEKGCYLVSVEGGNINTDFIPTQEIVWKEVAADITGKSTIQELVESVKAQIRGDTIIAVNFVGSGPLNHLVRRDPQDIVELISLETGCPATLRKLVCKSEIDLEQAAQSGTVLADIIRSANSLSELSDYELLELLCSKGPASDLRPYLEYYAKHGKLHDLIAEAEMSAIDRVQGAEE
ncbi:MAG: DNA repair exonuclease [archaeon]|nr:DNA repair exonuclease [archaeon]